MAISAVADRHATVIPRQGSFSTCHHNVDPITWIPRSRINGRSTKHLYAPEPFVLAWTHPQDL